jgi:hypothetical protein
MLLCVISRPNQQGGRKAGEVLTCGLTLPTSLARLPSLGKKSTPQGAERDTFSLVSRCKARQAAPRDLMQPGRPLLVHSLGYRRRTLTDIRVSVIRCRDLG